MTRMTRTLNLNMVLTAEEASLVREYGLYGRLPYNTEYTRMLVDGIARKLGFVKRFRGPRRDRSMFRYNECLKRDAVAAKLYHKMDYRRWTSAWTHMSTPTITLNFQLDDNDVGKYTYFLEEARRKFGA